MPEPSRFDHVRELDGLRGIAVAAVVVYHLWPDALPGGFIGVDVFFVLSGFLLSALLVREAERTGHVRFGSFMVRRIRRLLPATLLVLCALALYAATWANDVELARLRRHVFGSLTYSINWLFIADGTTYTDVVAGASPLRHVWSLAIEEQFYLMLAVAVAALVRFGSPGQVRRHLVLGGGVLAGISAAWMVALSLSGASLARTYFGTDTRMQAMLLGVAIGAWKGDVLLRRRLPGHRLPGQGWVVPGGIAAAVLVTLAMTAAEDATWMYRGGFTLVALAAVVVIVGALSMRHHRSTGWLRARPIVALGVISYGVYLWHWPVLVIIDEDRLGTGGIALAACRVALTLGLATASFVLVERPIRQGAIGAASGTLGRVAAPVASLAVAGMVIVATSVPATLGAAPSEPAAGGAPSGASTDSSTSTSDPASDPTSDPTPAPASDPAPADAASGDLDRGSAALDELQSSPASPLRLAVVGDSVAHTLIGGQVDGFLSGLPWGPEQSSFDPTQVEVLTVARPACSFLRGDVLLSDRLDPVDLSGFCDGWAEDLGATLAAPDPVDVTLALSTNDLETRSIDGRRVEIGSSEWESVLIEWLDQLRAITVTDDSILVLAATAPRLDPPWDEAVGVREAVMADAFERYAAAHDGVETLDLGPFLDGRDLRYDGLHYTTDGARAVAEWLTPQLRALAAD